MARTVPKDVEFAKTTPAVILLLAAVFWDVVMATLGLSVLNVSALGSKCDFLCVI